MAYLCIYNNYSGSLTIASTLFPLAYGAYGTSVAFYYNKSKAEQLQKIQSFGVEGNMNDAFGIEGNIDENEPTI